MEPVQDERRVDAVPFCVFEETGPEVVVLRLAERGVVPQPGRLEHLARQHDGVVENRRREERPPAEGGSSCVEEVDLPRFAVVVDVEDSRADEAHSTIRVQEREAACKPVRERGVVGIHPRDVAPASLIECPIQGARESELLVVSKNAHARIVQRGERGVRAVSGGVVDDDQLEVGDGLPKDALERGAHERLSVVHGDEDGDERRGH